jgi:hypothetical protein
LPTYLTYASGLQQFCWAHFTRNILSAQELAKTASAQRFCREALALQRQLFRLWYRFRGDPHARGTPLTRTQLIANALPIEKKFFALADRYVNTANNDVRNLARALFLHNQHFFTFVHEEGVESTNNAAERALRTAVQWRKIMFGNRSEDGEQAVARLLTVTRTCQLQQLNALAYLTAAIRSHRRRQAVASLAETANPLNCYVSRQSNRKVAHLLVTFLRAALAGLCGATICAEGDNYCREYGS